MPAFSVSPTLPSWVQEHLNRYLETNGEDGHLWDASTRGGAGMIPTLLLATRRRRSGDYLTLPLIYGETEGGYVIVASKGGAPKHPAWYHNLVADPEIRVQVRADRFAARARTTAGSEREVLWGRMVMIYSPYADYQAKTAREIPVVVLERTR